MKKTNKKSIKIIIIIIFIILGVLGYYFIIPKVLKDKGTNLLNSKEIIKTEKINYDEYFSSVVKTQKDKKIYKFENEFIEYGSISQDVILKLEKDINFDNGYFKVKDEDFYIDYKDIEKSEEEVADLFWKNYIPYNESVKTKDTTNFYLNEKLIMTLNTSMELPIVIKENDYYGIIYKDTLYYIKKSECDVFENTNTELLHTNAISTIVYHATYDNDNKEEKNKCIKNNAVICLSNIQFEEQMKYLVDNGFYTATMKDLEMFIDGKVQLPKNTVVITIDDGYYIDAATKVLEKYNLHATLFLIGELANVDEWKSDAWYSKSLELHSHSYNRHTPYVCSGGFGSIFKCGDKEDLLEDLRKSREQLNGTTVFCYPFFEYNDYSVSILKEAGFTMAFGGGRTKIKVGSDKMRLPRYGIVNTTTLSEFKQVIY